MKLLLAWGNEMKTDDGVALALLAQVQPQLPGWICQALPQPGPDLHLHWAGCNEAWLVDAVAAGLPPGHSLICDLLQPWPLELGFASAHGFGLGQALALARELGQLPPRLRLFGVQGASFAPGWGLSSQIQAQLPQLASDLLLALQGT